MPIANRQGVSHLASELRDAALVLFDGDAAWIVDLAHLPIAEPTDFPQASTELKGFREVIANPGCLTVNLP
jgi:hypothetical protein